VKIGETLSRIGGEVFGGKGGVTEDKGDVIVPREPKQRTKDPPKG